MSGDPDRKKSLREQVEEYKRRQKLADESTRSSAQPALGANNPVCR